MSSDLESLVKFYKIWGVVPTNKIHKYIFGVLLCMITFSTLYLSVNLHKFVQDKKSSAFLIPVVIQMLSMVFVNLANVLTSCRKRNIENFLRLISVYDDLQSSYFREAVRPSKYVVLKLIFAHVIFLFGIVLHLTFSVEKGVVHFFGMFNQNLMLLYQASTTVYLIMLLEVIYIRYASLTRLVQQSSRKSTRVLLRRIDCAVRCYRLLFDIIDTFNNLYGLIIALRVLSNVSAILLGVIIITHSSSYDPSVFIWFYWLILLSVQMIILSGLCKSIDDEKNKCFRHVFTLKSTVKNNSVISALKVLIHLVRFSSTEVTAAGFFKADYTILFTLVNIVATYTTAVLQLVPDNLDL